MGVDDKPVVPLEVRQRLEIHHLQVSVCQLEHANAQLHMQVADKVAALESIRLTRDREELAALTNTAHWRYDFDTREFARKPVPPTRVEAVVVDIEAAWLDGRLSYDVDPAAVTAAMRVHVRLRFRADDPQAKEAGRAELDRVFGHVSFEVAYVAVTDLQREANDNA